MTEHSTAAPDEASAAEALPEINRRRFLLNTAVIGAGVTVAASTAAAARIMTPQDRAIWHLRQLEQLVRETGTKTLHIAIVGAYGNGEVRGLAIQESGKLVGCDDFFASKGGAA